jgi:protein-disulfide isomerase
MPSTPIRLFASLTVSLLLALPVAHAQNAAGGVGDHFKDTSILKVPAGQRIALFEMEDLECPACGHAAPIVHAALEKYKIPFERHDFPLSQHVWSRDAAITARYLEDKVSAPLAEQYRLDVFANQASIASKDDLLGFTRSWFQKHSQMMPFVMDPSGRFAAEVQADQTLGERLGVVHTPTIIVISQKGWTQVVDVNQLYTVIDQALAASPTPAPVAKAGPKKPIVSGQH